jgi:hypothetical protein
MDRRAFLKTSLTAAAGAVLTGAAFIPMAGASITPLGGSVYNQQISLRGFLPSQQQAIIQYQTPPGNQPNSYGNMLALWQASQLPYGQAPLMTYPIQTNSSAGSYMFSEYLDPNQTYVVGYATSSDMTTVCSTITFYPGRTDGVAFSTQIHPEYIGSNTIAVSFQTPPGNQPAANGNWVGLWRGSTARYDGTDMLAKTPVPLESNQGTVAINGVPLLRGATYTVAYFIGEKNSDLAATFTMRT